MPHRQNHAAKMELQRQNRLASGLVSERFPSVSGIVINMTYYQKGGNPVVMLRTINLLPTNSAYLSMSCVIKSCVGGGFDLTPIITGMVKAKKKTLKGKLVCKGKSDSGAADHASVEYEIGIRYQKKSK